MTTKASAALPGKVWVGSYEFPIRVVPANDAALDGADGITETSEDGRGIFIASNLATRHRLEIVIHEITHAINWVNDFDDETAPILEEDVATRHGRAWALFFLDNPRYVAWLVYTVGRIRKDRTAKEPPPPVAEVTVEQTPPSNP